jgi:hypothetical protein
MAIEPSPPPPPPPPPSGDGPGRKSYTIGGQTLSLGALVSLISAVVLLISVFFDWYSAKVSINGVPGFSGSTSASVSGWDATDIAKLVFLLALVAGAALVVGMFVPTVNLPWPAWMISGVCGGVAVILVLYRIISKPHQDDLSKINFGGANGGIHASISSSFGIWLSLIAAIALTAGAYLLMNEPDESA